MGGFLFKIVCSEKVMNPKDSEAMKIKLKKIIARAKIDVYQLGVLPADWEEKFDRIKDL